MSLKLTENGELDIALRTIHIPGHLLSRNEYRAYAEFRDNHSTIKRNRHRQIHPMSMVHDLTYTYYLFADNEKELSEENKDNDTFREYAFKECKLVGVGTFRIVYSDYNAAVYFDNVIVDKSVINMPVNMKSEKDNTQIYVSDIYAKGYNTAIVAALNSGKKINSVTIMGQLDYDEDATHRLLASLVGLGWEVKNALYSLNMIEMLSEMATHYNPDIDEKDIISVVATGNAREYHTDSYEIIIRSGDVELPFNISIGHGDMLSVVLDLSSIPVLKQLEYKVTPKVLAMAVYAYVTTMSESNNINDIRDVVYDSLSRFSLFDRSETYTLWKLDSFNVMNGVLSGSRDMYIRPSGSVIESDNNYKLKSTHFTSTNDPEELTISWNDVVSDNRKLPTNGGNLLPRKPIDYFRFRNINVETSDDAIRVEIPSTLKQ